MRQGKKNGKSARPAGPVRMGDVARRLIRGGISRKSARESRILEAWPDVAPAGMQEKLTPVRLRAGVLWISVESPALLCETAQFDGKRILEDLKKALPDLPIESVRFKLG